MAKEVKIKIIADTSQAQVSVEKLNNSINKTGDVADKSFTRYSGNIKKSNILIEKLNQATGGLTNTLLDVGDAAKKAGISMRSALVATGVGALVVALGVVVAYWGDIKDFISGSNRELERQAKLLSEQEALQQHSLDLLNASEGTLKAQGKSQKEINKLKQEEIDKLIEIQTKELEIAESRLQSLLDIQQGGGKGLESFFRLANGLLANFAKTIDKAFSFLGLNTGFAESAFTLGDSIIEKIFGSKEDIQAQEDRIKALQLSLANLKSQSDTITPNKPLEKVEAVKGFDENKKNAEIEAEKEAAFQADLKRLEDGFLERVRIADAEVALQKEKNAKIKADEENLKNAKIAIAGQTLNILGSLAKEGSALAKGIAASQAVINTFQGVTAALSATSVVPDPFGTILKFANAVAIGVSGAINVKNILKTKPVTTSAPSGGGTGGAPPAPSFNLVQGSASNQIADSIQGQNKPIKAFVTSKDVTSGQEMDRNIEANAAL